jgi:hypothetical protein
MNQHPFRQLRYLTPPEGLSDDYRNRLVRRSLHARPELWEGAL